MELTKQIKSMFDEIEAEKKAVFAATEGERRAKAEGEKAKVRICRCVCVCVCDVM
jgi:hypothetical protein